MIKTNVELVERVSKKTGNKYVALELTFENGFKKLVFLDYAETIILSGLSKNN